MIFLLKNIQILSLLLNSMSMFMYGVSFSKSMSKFIVFCLGLSGEKFNVVFVFYWFCFTFVSKCITQMLRCFFDKYSVGVTFLKSICWMYIFPYLRQFLFPLFFRVSLFGGPTSIIIKLSKVFCFVLVTGRSGNIGGGSEIISTPMLFKKVSFFQSNHV